MYIKMFQFHALGDFRIRNGTDTIVNYNKVTETLVSDAGGIGFTFEALYQNAKQLHNQEWYIGVPTEGVHVLFAAWQPAVGVPYQTTKIGLQSEVTSLFLGAESLPGFSFAFYTENSLISGLPFCTNDAVTNIYVNGGAIVITDWLWSITNNNNSTIECNWNIIYPTNVTSLWVSVKDFQMVNGNDTSLLVYDSGYETILNTTNTSTGSHRLMASYPSDSLKFSFADGTFIYRYDAIYDDNKILSQGNSIKVKYTSSDITSSRGLVLHVWEAPKYCASYQEIRLPSSNICTYISDHYGSGSFVGGGAGGGGTSATSSASKSCRWSIIPDNSTTSWTTNGDKIVIVITELEMGTANTQAFLDINSVLTKNAPIHSPVGRHPPLVVFSESDFIPNFESFEIKYNSGIGGGQGFKLLITSTNSINQCLSNVIGNVNLGEGDVVTVPFINTQLYNSTSPPGYIQSQNDFHFIAKSPVIQGISHLATLTNLPEIPVSTGRFDILTTVGGYSVPRNSSELSLVAVNEVLVLRWKSFKIDPVELSYFNEPSIVESEISVPTTLHESKVLYPKKVAGFGTNDFVAMYVNYRGNKYLFHYSVPNNYNFTGTDLSLSDPLPRSKLWTNLPASVKTDVTGNLIDAYETYSISSCRNSLLYSYKRKQTGLNSETDPTRAPIRLEMIKEISPTLSSRIQYDTPSTALYFGRIIRPSPSCSWIYTTFSPQVDIILQQANNQLTIKAYISTEGQFYGHDFVIREWNNDGSMVTVDTAEATDNVKGFYVGCYGREFLNIQLRYYTFTVRNTTGGLLRRWGTDPQNRSPIVIDSDACELDSNHLTIDANEDASVIVIGAPTRARVYFVWNSFPLLNNTWFKLCITNDLDPNFGSYVSFSGFADSQQQVLVTGSKIYPLWLDKILFSLQSNPGLLLDAMNSTCLLLDVLIPDTQFMPNRVLYNGETWRSSASTEPLFLGQNSQSLFVLRRPSPLTSDEFKENLRILPISPPGFQWTNPNPAKPRLELQPCPPGSYSRSNNLFCLLCTVDSYQPDWGSNSCLPCDDDKYCPTGSSVQLDSLARLGQSPFLSVKPKFATQRSVSMNELVSNFMVLPVPAPGSNQPGFGFVLWGFILFILLIAITSRMPCRILFKFRRNSAYVISLMDPADKHDTVRKKPKDRSSRGCLRLIHRLVNNCRVQQTKYPVTGKLSAGVNCIVLHFITVMAIIFAFYVFFDYQQYDGSRQLILNAVRTTNYQPFFSATEKVEYALSYLQNQPITLQIGMNGFTLENCQSLCNQVSPVYSQGCLFLGGECYQDPDLKKRISCFIVNNGTTCNFQWNLPPNVEIYRTNLFQFNLRKAFIQELEISATQEASTLGIVEEPLNSKDSLKLSRSYFREKVQLPQEQQQYVLYGVFRQYELIYSVRSSEQLDIFSPGTDFSVQLVWNSLQSLFDGAVTTGDFFAQSNPNTVSIQLVISPSFIYNIETRALSFTGFIIALVVLLVAIRSAFLAVWSCGSTPLFVLHKRYRILTKLAICCCCYKALDDKLKVSDLEEIEHFEEHFDEEEMREQERENGPSDKVFWKTKDDDDDNKKDDNVALNSDSSAPYVLSDSK
eukprot:TRINITY_DN4368_c0_g3_i1.p1 TRINITY_DN4368_c0_g3~~TRINITY_DN4368_c0_g3_i1.p1  ORF type:complete len:1676 (+),score=352.84 TRINITY_DN4368_c0_g3_i1:247-5028(+)